MSDYEEFLEKYARDHHITKEVAETHLLVKETKKYYEELNNAKSIQGLHTH